MTDSPAKEAWCVIPSGALLDMLRRCAAGEDPDAVMVEFYANSEHHD